MKSDLPLVDFELNGTAVKAVEGDTILEAARQGVPAFVREVEVFDQYRGKGVQSGQKSLALRIVMQDTARTLTDAEVEEIVGSVRQLLAQKFKALPRT